MRQTTMHAHTHFYDQFRNMHAFGWWEGVRVRKEYPRMHGEKHANSTQKGPSPDSNEEALCCEVTLLTTTPNLPLLKPNLILFSFHK